MSQSKKLTCKGTLRQVFIFLSPPLRTVNILYTYSHREGVEGWGRVEPKRRLESQQFTKLGQKYQHMIEMYLQSINSRITQQNFSKFSPTNLNFKGLVAVCHSFCLFLYFNIHTVQSSNHIHTIHSPRPFSISSSLVAQWERPPCGAEPGIELGPAFQQADALPTEPRRTIAEPRRTILSHAAPIEI